MLGCNIHEGDICSISSTNFFVKRSKSSDSKEDMQERKKPTIELHITNIYNREDFRHKSLISKAVNGIICGQILRQVQDNLRDLSHLIAINF